MPAATPALYKIKDLCNNINGEPLVVKKKKTQAPPLLSYQLSLISNLFNDWTLAKGRFKAITCAKTPPYLTLAEFEMCKIYWLVWW